MSVYQITHASTKEIYLQAYRSMRTLKLLDRIRERANWFYPLTGEDETAIVDEFENILFWVGKNNNVVRPIVRAAMKSIMQSDTKYQVLKSQLLNRRLNDLYEELVYRLQKMELESNGSAIPNNCIKLKRQIKYVREMTDIKHL